MFVGGGCGAEFAGVGRKGGELGCGAAEGAGAVEEVAGMGAKAAERAACGGGTDEDDVGEDDVGRRLRGVTAGERDVVGGGEGEEAVEKTIEPARVAGDGFRHGEGEECGEGLGSHGGEIAEAAGQGAMADGGWAMPVAAKVAIFEGEVGGDEQLVAVGWFEDGAVVADAEADGV